MFANVLKKFFTKGYVFENKEATNLQTGVAQMLNELKEILDRTSSTLLSDFAGAAALVIMLVVGLHLPGLV